ncbi:sensor histidine kinase [Desulfonatronum thiodismutans]|uniref:sensor histidine kinase n=1 Tax=Desulfonatronum thiodismutans TaxID=159290 RepID=UPI0004ABE3F5|nr:ATP-binding protein [Desulfonatronum thiodismutans]
MTDRAKLPWRSTLLLKLLLVNLPVIVLVMFIVWWAIGHLAADYFTALMQEYDIAPDTTHAMFLEAVNRYLLWAALFALLLATVSSLLLTRQVLKPLRAMQDATRQVSAGHYAARVPVTTSDELADLGRAFNRMSEALERNEYLRRKLVADVAHELRTPLTNLRGYLEGVADGVVAADQHTLELLQGELMRLVRLVDDLHSLTEAEAGGLRLDREHVDLAALVERELELARPMIETGAIVVSRNFSAGSERIHADPDKLSRILRNLLENACRYTPREGLISVSGRRNGDRVRLEVANTGATIPAADLPHIFERFYRVERARSRETGGAGIGLAIVRELVEAHDGQVGASSEDGWTRVWIELPERLVDSS